MLAGNHQDLGIPGHSDGFQMSPNIDLLFIIIIPFKEKHDVDGIWKLYSCLNIEFLSFLQHLTHNLHVFQGPTVHRGTE